MTEGTKPGISTVRFSKLEGSWRLDAEYYQPHYLAAAEKLQRCGRVSEIIECALHPAEIKREYSEAGLQLLLAQNVRRNYLDFSTTVFMPETVAGLLRKNRLHPGDVVVVRTGANAGDTACYDGEPERLYASAHLILIRPKGIEGAYLSTYFNTEIGRQLVRRGVYGSSQPEIAPAYVETLPVPRSDTVERGVVELVNQAREARRKSKRLYHQAEQLLLDKLGLSDLDRSLDLFGEASVFDASCASRIDSDFFEPKYDRLLEHMYNLDAQPVGDMARLRQEKFSPQEGVSFSYIEISDVNLSNGLCHASEVPGKEAPDRAQQIVRTGDIVVSTVRPLRGGIALIRPNQDGFVCSSGFAVLDPLSVSAEYLLVYLRLKPIRELLNRSNRASMYPAITSSDVLNLPIIVSDDNEMTVRGLIQESHQAYSRGLELLEQARRKVEAMIESEAAHG